MLALGHDRATFVGHSLGGGIAMQMAYQFPERVERLVLVSSGGLGRQVARACARSRCPARSSSLPMLGVRPLVNAGAKVGGRLGKVGLRIGADLVAYSQGMATLADIEARSAFVHTARGMIDLGGQRIDARDKLYLTAGVPTLIVWGERDPVIPAATGIRAHELDAGQPPRDRRGRRALPPPPDPDAFATAVQRFVATTSPRSRTSSRCGGCSSSTPCNSVARLAARPPG